MALIALTLAQVIQVSDGDCGQTLIAGIAEQLPGALHELLGSRTGERPV
jgi:hypothetical protein